MSKRLEFLVAGVDGNFLVIFRNPEFWFWFWFAIIFITLIFWKFAEFVDLIVLDLKAIDDGDKDGDNDDDDNIPAFESNVAYGSPAAAQAKVGVKVIPCNDWPPAAAAAAAAKVGSNEPAGLKYPGLEIWKKYALGYFLCNVLFCFLHFFKWYT